MRTCLYVVIVATLFASTAMAQQEEGSPNPREAEHSATLPRGVEQAMEGLKSVTVGEIRAMTDGELRAVKDLCSHWVEIVSIEQKRRKDKRSVNER